MRSVFSIGDLQLYSTALATTRQKAKTLYDFSCSGMANITYENYGQTADYYG
jgi:hypothetical protein